MRRQQNINNFNVMDVDLSETDRFLTVHIDERVNFNISIYNSLDNYSSSFLSFTYYFY